MAQRGDNLADLDSIEALTKDAERIGGIFDMNYGECTILTNDFWTDDAGGLPQHSFLVAKSLLPAIKQRYRERQRENPPRTVRQRSEKESEGEEPIVDDAAEDRDDAEQDSVDHALLLRVLDPADLSDQQGREGTRQKAMRETLLAEQKNGKLSEKEVVDAYTQLEIQYSGVRAKVLGTIFQNQDGELAFESDTATFHSAGNYLVYKPNEHILSLLASHPTAVTEENVDIGNVRYSATRLAGKSIGDTPMYVDPKDFVGNKTAILGMTRTGKSNTIKALATAIHDGEIKVGQLVFDPAGEYAYANQQDEWALGDLSTEAVRIYKYDATEKEKTEGVRSLNANFFEENNLPSVKGYVESELAHRIDDSIYLNSFVSTVHGLSEEIDERIMDYGEVDRARRKRSAFYAVLAKAGLKPHAGFSITIGCNKKVKHAVFGGDSYSVEDPDEYWPDDSIERKSRGRIELDASGLAHFWTALAEAESDNLVSNADPKWIDDDLSSIIELLQSSGNKAGFRVLDGLRVYHNPEARGSSPDQVYQDLCEGRIAIIDTSYGREEVVTAEAERIVRHILSTSVKRFKRDEQLPNINIYLEEAHRHFEQEVYRESHNDPYVRLAKEGAKYDLGMVYATQEVTSVDERVLANTANWFVTHLNSDKELNALSNYYDFSDFQRPIKRVKKAGMSRVRTVSGSYLVPVRIREFTREWITDNTDIELKDEVNENMDGRESSTSSAEMGVNERAESGVSE